jgi:hypothetical protein
MVNYRVDDLHNLVKALEEEGCKVLEKIDVSEYGKFAWVIDPEGNKIELWEPTSRHNLHDQHTVVSLPDSRRTHLRSSYYCFVLDSFVSGHSSMTAIFVISDMLGIVGVLMGVNRQSGGEKFR